MEWSNTGELGRVIIATDGSGAAAHSLELGLAIADRMGAEVTIVHVVTTDRVREGETYWSEDDDRILNEAGERARALDLEPKLTMCSGHPAEQIVKVAEREDAGLVVVGSRGRGRVKGTLLGSVSRAVLDHSQRPVLVVR